MTGRSLIISKFGLLDPGRDVAGIFARFKMFLAAIGSISSAIDYLAIVQREEFAANPDVEAISASQSDYWGFPIRTTLVPSNRGPDSLWRHYGAGIISAAEQPSNYQWTGPAQVRAIAEHMDRQPDLVFVMGLPCMNALVRSKCRPKRLFFDLNDVEHWARYRSALRPPIRPGSLGYLAHVPALFVSERRAAALSEAMFVCSDLDRNYLRRVGMGPRIVTIPNAARFPADLPPLVAEPILLFIGAYSYDPNRDAAERLVNKIWPLIRGEMPTALLTIAGKWPERIPSFRQPPPGVEFTGYVDDLDQLYARCRVVTCPIMTGGGTRVKLIEAASRAKPMVSTRIGAEGLDLRDGHEILLRDDDAGFAAACVRLLRDDAAAQALGSAARIRAERLYEARAVEKKIAAIMQSPPGA